MACSGPSDWIRYCRAASPSHISFNSPARRLGLCCRGWRGGLPQLRQGVDGGFALVGAHHGAGGGTALVGPHGPITIEQLHVANGQFVSGLRENLLNLQERRV